MGKAENAVMRMVEEYLSLYPDLVSVKRTNNIPVFDRARGCFRAMKEDDVTLDFSGFELVSGRCTLIEFETKAPGEIPKKRAVLNPGVSKQHMKNIIRKQKQWDRVKKIQQAGGFSFFCDDIEPVKVMIEKIQMMKKEALWSARLKK